jgi:hypothetical protein
VRIRPPACITTILTYILATLVIFQGVMMLFPVTAVRIAQDLISQDRRRRKHEAELAQVFPDVWVQHIVNMEEESTPITVYRRLD